MTNESTDKKQKSIRILVVDDEEIARDNLTHILSLPGNIVTTVDSGRAALRALDEHRFDVVVTDLKMRDLDGLQVLEYAKQKDPHIQVIMITGHGSIPTAIEAMKKGAYHYITKPVKLDEVRITVDKALEKKRLQTELQTLREDYNALVEMPFIVGKSPRIQRVIDLVRQIAPTDCNVLITGETGTGKELIARAIHSYSRRAKNRFMAFNCAAFNEELLANELFGHEKGAFTGAVGLRKGLLEVAGGGTVFMDEIGEMPLTMQVKLLRVLQEKTLLRVGGSQEVSVDIRIVAAANNDLKAAVELNKFRKDLYFRLNVVEVHLPPLSERRDDIPLLVMYFLQKFSRRHGKQVETLSDDAMLALKSFPYEGNVRELENVIERAVALSQDSIIRKSDLPDAFQKAFPALDAGHDSSSFLSLEAMEKEHIRSMLKQAGGNKTRAAQMLGIPRVTLWRKIKRLDLDEFS